MPYHFVRPFCTAVLAAAAACAVGACAGNNELLLPKLPSAAPEVGSVTPGGPSAPMPLEQGEGSATEVYSRIATGAMSCWFGAAGPLKRDYIYHAEADAPSRGGKAEIVIHQRDPTQPNPRGAKAYRINIDPTGDETAAVRVQNLKMTDAFATAMSGDVGRWTKGDQGCAGTSTAVGWVPAAEVPPAQQSHHSGKKAAKKSKPKPHKASAAPKQASQ